MRIKSDLAKIQKIALCFLILANLTVGIYVLYSRQSQSPARKIIPAAELTENAVVKKRIDELMEKNQTRQIAVALLTSASTVCTTGKIADLFKESAPNADSKKFVVFLPNHFTQQEVENFKTNLDFNLEVERADDELAREWLPLAEKYEALGVVIISDNGKLTVSQETKKIEESLATFK